MSFIFASTFEEFNEERMVHHTKGNLIQDTFCGVTVCIQSKESNSCVAKHDRCLVAILGTIEQCSPQQLLSRYLKEGIDVSGSLFGSFVALIVHENRIFVIRDPMGLRTVYYREEEGGRLSISSDPVALMRSDNLEDNTLQQMFFHGGHILYGTKHWGGIHQLRPGCWMSRYAYHRVQQIPYYQIPKEREKEIGLQRWLYRKTLIRIVKDTAHVQYLVPQKNIQTLVLLQQLKKHKRNITLYGLQNDTWVQTLGDYFSMPVELVEVRESMWDTIRSVRWYGGSPAPHPEFLRMYSLSSYLQNKDVYIPVEESFGGSWMQRFLLLLHYFSPNRGEAYIRACMGAGELSQLPKAKRMRTQINKQMNTLLSFDGQHIIDGAIRTRLQQWGGMVLLPMLRAFFPHASFPLFDERLVRISLSMPKTHVVHKGVIQHWYRSSLLKNVDKEIISLCSGEKMDFTLDEKCRIKARKKLELAPIHEGLKQVIQEQNHPNIDRMLWYILQIS